MGSDDDNGDDGGDDDNEQERERERLSEVESSFTCVWPASQGYLAFSVATLQRLFC